MSNFSYEEYAAQQKAARASNAENIQGNNGLEVHYLNEFLKNDGDTIVVRFPYHTLNDLTFESTHSVSVPGRRFPMRVRCEGQNCEFCSSGIKVDMRFFLKCLTYVVDETTGGIKLINCVWDRPAAFADTQMKTLLQEYGDLSTQLFKIRRSGSGMQTRYAINIILNTAVYNPSIYKADFTELDKIDPVKLCTNSIEKYRQAMNGGSENQAQVNQPAQASQQPAYNQSTQPIQSAQQPYTPSSQQSTSYAQYQQQPQQMTPATEAPPAYTYSSAPTQQPYYQQSYNTAAVNEGVASQPITPAQQPTADPNTERRQTRYTF